MSKPPILFLVLGLAFWGLALGGHSVSPVVSVPRGIPETLWTSRVRAALLTPQKIALGEDLFRDPLLSSDGTISCATCHDPAIGYADHNQVAIGIGKRAGVRNTPSLVNVVFSDALFWDGRASRLEEQALNPLLNPAEMGAQREEDVVRRVSENLRYRRRFSTVFKQEGVTIQTVLTAIGAFERTVLSGDSEFDRFRTGDRTGMSESAERGWHLFRGRAGCIRCHPYAPERPFFTDSGFHNTGIASRHPDFATLAKRAQLARTPAAVALLRADAAAGELGRFRITGRLADIGAFKTPTLRDVALTSPYMHDGSIASLGAVIAYYNEGGHPNPYQSSKIAPLALDARSQRDLVAFLESLTSAGLPKGQKDR